MSASARLRPASGQDYRRHQITLHAMATAGSHPDNACATDVRCVRARYLRKTRRDARFASLRAYTRRFGRSRAVFPPICAGRRGNLRPPAAFIGPPASFERVHRRSGKAAIAPADCPRGIDPNRPRAPRLVSATCRGPRDALLVAGGASVGARQRRIRSLRDDPGSSGPPFNGSPVERHSPARFSPSGPMKI